LRARGYPTAADMRDMAARLCAIGVGFWMRSPESHAKLIGAPKVSRAYQAGHDPEFEIGDTIEVKARASGFGQLYGWLDNRDILVIKADY
jgi:hypothetical protein